MNKKHKYWSRIFFAPDDEGGGAPASATADPWHHNGDDDGGDGDDGTSLERQMPNVDPGAGGGGSGTPSPQLATIDPKAFAASFGEVLGKTFQQQQAAPPAPPTPEQIAEARKALNFFDIDDNFIKEFGDLGTQKAALEKFRDGLTKHNVTVFNHLMANMKAELEKRFETEFTPVRSMLEERRAAETQQRFHDTYPQFAEPKLAPYVNSAVEQLRNAKAFEGKTEAQCFDLVANFLAEGAKAYNPNFVLQKASPSSQPSRSGNGLPVTSGGSGRSAGGGAPSSAEKKSWALSHMK